MIEKHRKALRKALKEKPSLNPAKLKKRPEQVMAHQKQLVGLGFGGCAPCGGCAPQTVMVYEGVLKMKCGHGGHLVTAAQAQACDGTKPLVETHRAHQPHPIFHRNRR